MIITCDSTEVGTLPAILGTLGVEPVNIFTYDNRHHLVVADNEPALDRLRVHSGVVGISEGSEVRLSTRSVRHDDSTVQVGPYRFGDDEFIVIAGPCAVESREQLLSTAEFCERYGAHMLRGGIFKPRTSPAGFQGLRERGAHLIGEARERTGMPTVSEATGVEAIAALIDHVDMIQIGARNMQNYDLLTAAGRSGLPVILKRGLSATIDEWLYAADYVLAGGAPVVLCERGIRTFESATRFTLDLSAIPVVKRLSHLPIIVDPSHAAGDSGLVGPLAIGAAAMGADGLLVEVHHDPSVAMCDGRQALDAPLFDDLLTRLEAVLAASGRQLAGKVSMMPAAL